MCKIGLDGRARCESLLCGEALGGRQSGQGEADEATMNVTVLIDAIVRQTTVLIAQLATTAGVRAPLAHIANQIFLDLVGELEEQGVGQKVIADMFGLALRSYQQKVRRLSESATQRGVSLWEAVFQFLQEKEVATRPEVLEKFKFDNEASVRGILNDLVESGLVYKTGRGHSTIYRVTSDEDMSLASGDPLESASSLVWVLVYRHGPIRLEELREQLHLDDELLLSSLERLEEDGRIDALHDDGEVRYSSSRCVIELGDNAGWEAAMFDHYQAMVAAVCTKLRNGATRALPDDRIGGSTLSFDVWPGHPHQNRVYNLLKRTRKEAIDLWDDVASYNTTNPRPADQVEKVTFYVGQTIQIDTTQDNDED